jgi:hypothetical protein
MVQITYDNRYERNDMERSRNRLPIFGVRVPKEFQDEIRARAKVEGISVGAFLEKHLRSVLSSGPAPTLESRMEAVERRLDALEQRKGAKVRVQTDGSVRAAEGRLPRSPKNKTPPDVIAKITELSRQGMSGQQIADEMGGITKSQVNKILQRVRRDRVASGP